LAILYNMNTKPSVLVTSQDAVKLGPILDSFVGTILFFRSKLILPRGVFVKGLALLDHTQHDYHCELSDGVPVIEGKPSLDVSKLAKENVVEELQKLTGARLNTWSHVKTEAKLPHADQATLLPELPSLATQAKTLIGSLAEWAKRGMKVVDADTLQVRLDICAGCEFWNPRGFKGTGRCMKCGCSTQAKLRMATASCPVNKWAATA
jgi:hypothetical protein